VTDSAEIASGTPSGGAPAIVAPVLECEGLGVGYGKLTVARDITFTNVKIESVRGFLVQDGANIVFDHVQISPTTGDAIVLDHGSVSWNGEAKSGTSGGSPIPFYNDN